jgi:hypothetical protein
MNLWIGKLIVMKRQCENDDKTSKAKKNDYMQGNQTLDYMDRYQKNKGLRGGRSIKTLRH